MFEITSNRLIAVDTYEMILRGDGTDIESPGRFINIALDGFYLRRPMSICDWNDDEITIIFKIVGDGTAALANAQPGELLDVLCPLGHGFEVDRVDSDAVVVGGGAGVPPLYGLTRRLVERGISPDVILGFDSCGDVFYEEEFARLGVNVTVTTRDGSRGVQGLVTDAMPTDRYVCACGPEAMMAAVAPLARTGQFSLEERMGCGFGACMGCSRHTVSGFKKICTDGPVLFAEEIAW